MNLVFSEGLKSDKGAAMSAEDCTAYAAQWRNEVPILAPKEHLVMVLSESARKIIEDYR